MTRKNYHRRARPAKRKALAFRGAGDVRGYNGVTDTLPWGFIAFGLGVLAYFASKTQMVRDAVEQAGEAVYGYVYGVPAKINVSPVGNGQVMRTDAALAFLAMQAAARHAGYNLSPTSGFRSQEQQERLYTGWINKLPGFNLAARPGYSNHQSGISIDIGGLGGYHTEAYKWLAANAAKFGFVNDVSGEYWHWTYKLA